MRFIDDGFRIDDMVFESNFYIDGNEIRNIKSSFYNNELEWEVGIDDEELDFVVVYTRYETEREMNDRVYSETK